MIRCAGREDLPQLTALWGVCFGDSEEEIGAFWKLLSGKARVFCAREGKSVVSMACALPVQLVDAQGESHPAAYLYAVGKAPAYRRRGLCAQVLSFAEDDLRKSGAEYALLVPSSPSLFEFYQKFGYRTAFYRAREEISVPACAGTVSRIGAEEYFNLRELLLFENFISCGPEFLAYQAVTDRLYRIETRDRLFCAVCSEAGGQLRIKELLPYEPAAAALLLQSLGCAGGDCLAPGETIPFGMCRSLRGAPLPAGVYLGLALD